MKRFLTLTLALLIVLMLVSAGGSYAAAEEENPYLGLWQITGQQDGDTYTAYADMGITAYLDFLPSGAIYAVMTDGSELIADYMGYQVTGENTLDIYEGEDPLSSTFDPATGVISVTDPEDGLISFVERVTTDPLPDIRAMAADLDEEKTYFGYKMTEGDQTIDILTMLPVMGMDPEDFYLTLELGGTGYIQFGSEEAGGDITWTETEFTPVESPDQPVTYTWEGDHILLAIDDTTSIEFAPEGEVEALMAMLGIEVAEPDEGEDVEAADVVGEWKLAKATAMGQEMTIEQIQAQGLDLAFRFNADGSAVMINKGEETDGISWAVEDGEVSLTVGSYELFTFTYDGEYLILSVGAKIFFEKVN